jgi:hypothetical protein
MKGTEIQQNLEQDLIIDGQVLEVVHNYSYSSTLINLKNVISENIKSRIAAGNRCFDSLRQIFRSRAMGKAVKITIYRMMVKPVVVFGSETWPMTEMDKKSLSTWEDIGTSGRTRNMENKK